MERDDKRFFVRVGATGRSPVHRLCTPSGHEGFGVIPRPQISQIFANYFLYSSFLLICVFLRNLRIDFFLEDLHRG